MIIYNITIKVDRSVADAWVYWMKAEHMPELMNTDLFIDCRLSRLLEQDETDGITFSVQYFCEGIEQYDNYIDQYAEKMRERSNKMFGGKYVAFRTIMEVIN
jgi:hypothetical protein